jgi:hypothetical protein
MVSTRAVEEGSSEVTKGLKPGQFTAIWTGAVSLVFGVSLWRARRNDPSSFPPCLRHSPVLY